MLIVFLDVLCLEPPIKLVRVQETSEKIAQTDIEIVRRIGNRCVSGFRVVVRHLIDQLSFAVKRSIGPADAIFIHPLYHHADVSLQYRTRQTIPAERAEFANDETNIVLIRHCPWDIEEKTQKDKQNKPFNSSPDAMLPRRTQDGEIFLLNEVLLG